MLNRYQRRSELIPNRLIEIWKKGALAARGCRRSHFQDRDHDPGHADDGNDEKRPSLSHKLTHCLDSPPPGCPAASPVPSPSGQDYPNGGNCSTSGSRIEEQICRRGPRSVSRMPDPAARTIPTCEFVISLGVYSFRDTDGELKPTSVEPLKERIIDTKNPLYRRIGWTIMLLQNG